MIQIANWIANLFILGVALVFIAQKRFAQRELFKGEIK